MKISDMRRWIFAVTILLTGFSVLEAQECKKSHSLDSLYSKFGQAKTFDTALMEPALLALQYYPELKDVEIKFRRKKISTLMAARPGLDFLFRKKEKRTYVVYVSTNTKNHSHKLISNMSKCAQTGIIGHEFAHILSYTEMSNSQVILFAIKYFFARKKIERETDLITVERGLGDQMLHFNRHIRSSKHASQKYLKRKSKYYLSIAEIEEIVNTF